jgi:hypothetical protein
MAPKSYCLRRCWIRNIYDVYTRGEARYVCILTGNYYPVDTRIVRCIRSDFNQIARVRNVENRKAIAVLYKEMVSAYGNITDSLIRQLGICSDLNGLNRILNVDDT